MSTPPNPAPPPPLQIRPYLIAALIAALIVGTAIVIVETITGRSVPAADNLLTADATIIVLLLGQLGLAAAVQGVHVSLNGRLDQLVATAAREAYQKGQANAIAVVAQAAVPVVTEPPAPPAGG